MRADEVLIEDQSSPDVGGLVPVEATEARALVGKSPRAHGAVAKHGLWMLAVLSALMGFASISTDLYLPAMPAMGAALHTDAGTIEWTISGYLIGFSLGQLLWGPLGDRHGRRIPVALGLVLFVIGSAGCALSASAVQIIAWRVVQAVGACAGVVLARAMVRDLYAGARAAQMLSTLMTVMAVAPLLGPFLGGQILVLASWRAIFWTLVAVGSATLAALLTLPETLPPEHRNPGPLGQALAGYGKLVKSRAVIGYAGVGSFFYAGIYAYLAGTPSAYIDGFHVSPQRYGVLFSLGIVGIMATNLVNARWVMKLGTGRLLRAGAGGAALSGLVAAYTAWTGAGGLLGLVVPLFFFVGATGFITANSIAGALAEFPDRAGAVSALVGAMHYGSGILGSALVGAFADSTSRPLGCVIALAGVGSFTWAWWLVPRGKDPLGA